MKRWGIALSVGLLALAVVPSGRGQAPNESETRLRKDLAFLTSDACEGRGITTKGIQLAAEHIAAEFRKAGLKPGGPDGTYFQTFKIAQSFRVEPKDAVLAELQLSGPLGQTIVLRLGRDFALQSRSGTAALLAPLVFAGHGIDSRQPSYDDFDGVTVKGKAIVLLTRAPRASSPFASHFPASNDAEEDVQSIARKVANARKRGAAAVLLVNTRGLTDSFPMTPYSPRLGELFDIPVVYLSRDMTERMLFASTRRSLAQLEKDIDITLKPQPTDLTGWTCKIKVNRIANTVEVKNVIGVLEGSGPLARETVVMGAHYDHMGLEGNRRMLGGSSPPGGIGGVGFPLIEASRANIYRGADDNASGTSAVMELARRLSGLPNRTGRRLVFMAFSAEESGLLGSRYYVRHPVFPLKDTAAMVNLDQVGRMQDSRLLAMGVGTGKGLESLVDRLALKHELKLRKALTGAGPTDHMSFCQAGVPGLAFFTGFHEYYHLPSDRIETLNITGLRRVVDLTADVLHELALEPVRREFVNDMRPFDRSQTLWSSAPCVGAELDFTHKGPGVRVRSVMNGTPAAKAGLKAGDRLESVGGKEVEGVAVYLDTVRALRPGTKVDLKGEREGKPLALTLELARVPFLAALGLVPEARDQLGGVLLADVNREGLAARAGLQGGDRITAVDGKQIKTLLELYTLTSGIRKGTKVELSYLRKGEKRTATILAD